jgi:hypothetical protein
VHIIAANSFQREPFELSSVSFYFFAANCLLHSNFNRAKTIPPTVAGQAMSLKYSVSFNGNSYVHSKEYLTERSPSLWLNQR